MADLNVEMFLRLETAMWDSLVAGDGRAAARLLSDDYLGVYSTGFADRDAYIAALADGPVVSSYRLSDQRIMVVSDTAVMFSYRADLVPLTKGVAEYPEAMYISSLWCHRGDSWVNVFSQDTDAEVSTPAPESD